MPLKNRKPANTAAASNAEPTEPTPSGSTSTRRGSGNLGGSVGSGGSSGGGKPAAKTEDAPAQTSTRTSGLAPSSKGDPASGQSNLARKGYKRHFYRTAKFYPYSILDSPEWKNGQFFGFYVLFWVVCGVYHAQTLIQNYIARGRILDHEIIDTLMRNLWQVALVDFVMYLLMYPAFFYQKLVQYGWVNWNRGGWVVQHIYQTAYLVLFMSFARSRSFTWIAQIFLTLHALVQMMKMHSFAVFNGMMKGLSVRLAKSVKAVNSDDTDAASQLDKELIDEARDEIDIYPRNLTLKNFFMYTMYPTVVYEVKYPRTDRIRWGYTFGKLLATFGIFSLMIIISQQWMHPVAIHANELRQHTSLKYRLKQYPLILMEVFPPFMLLYILTFYLIWDAICNCIAELTMFGDREFYRDWWNSRNWAKFARDWNVPVHNFLQRHVYTTSRLFLHFSRWQATFLTFLFSAFVHELAMYVIFGRFRGYLLLMQLTQLPMQLILDLKFFKDRPTLCLVFFWMSVATGPSIICSLYLTF